METFNKDNYPYKPNNSLPSEDTTSNPRPSPIQNLNPFFGGKLHQNQNSHNQKAVANDINNIFSNINSANTKAQPLINSSNNDNNEISNKDPPMKKSTFNLLNSQMQDIANNNYKILNNLNFNNDNQQDKVSPCPQINIFTIEKYDDPHGMIDSIESMEYKNEKIKNFEEDSHFTSIPVFSIPTITRLEKLSELDEETLTSQVELDLMDELQNEEALEESIFTKLNEYENLKKDLFRNFNISQCYQKFDSKDYQNYRIVYKDGDSFYRAFMFSYIEKIIINKNLYEIKKILYEISAKISQNFAFRNCGIIKKEVYIILRRILNQMKENKIYDAIKTLNRGFCMNDNFCNCLIKYMKIKISEFLIHNKGRFNAEELITNKFICETYFDEEKKLNCEKYNNDKVLMMQTEPEVFIVYITPYVFPNATMRLYVNERNEVKPMTIEIKSLNECNKKENLICNKFDPKNYNLNIDLIYASKHGYSIAYDNSYFTKNANELSYLVIKEKDKNICDSFDVLLQSEKCEKCKNTCSQIQFKIVPSQIFCIECVKRKIGKILSTRIARFKSENCTNLEFYTRPIALHYTKQYELGDCEVNDLIGMGIGEQFILKMKSTCLRCLEFIDQDCNSRILSCGCKMCLNCLGAFIMKDSNEFVILSSFEEKYLRFEKSKCVCGKMIDLSEVRRLVYTVDELEEYRNKAKERSKKYLMFYCMRCGCSLRKEETKGNVNVNGKKDEGNLVDAEPKKETQTQNANLKKFEIIKEIQDVKDNHLICEKCGDEYDNELKKRIRDKEIKKEDKYTKIHCIICDIEHEIHYPLKKTTSCTCSIF